MLRNTSKKPVLRTGNLGLDLSQKNKTKQKSKNKTKTNKELRGLHEPSLQLQKYFR